MSKFLVLKLAAIGDAVLSLAAIEALRDENPAADITLLIGNACAPVAEHHPAINHLWKVDETIFWKKRPLALLKLARQLRRERFDRVYVLHWSPLFNYFFKLVGIPERWGFARDSHSNALTRQVPYVEASPVAHDAAQYLNVISPKFAVSAIPARRPKIYLTHDELAWAEVQTRPYALPIAMAPGGGNNPKLFMPQKRWVKERFHDLAALLLQNHNVRILVLGDLSEQPLLAPLAEQFPERVKIFSGVASLRQTAALIQSSRLFIGNDSGLMHISGAVGTPSLSFFGPTSPNGKLPVWLPHRVMYTHEPCSPCYKHGYAPPCPYELKCMTHISTEDAYAAALDLLKESHATSA